MDLTNPQEIGRWSPINDAVMGGLSESGMQFDPAGHAVFSGKVSLANNGGFASVRCHPGKLGVSGAIAYLLDVQGDARHYKFNLRTEGAFDGVNYQCRFHPPTGLWSTCRLACADFVPTWRGKPVPGAPPLDPQRVRQIGFMIAERQTGNFSLAIRGIAVEIGKE